MDCIGCHSNPKVVTSKRVFMDNSPPLSDILKGNATLDYPPLSLWPLKSLFYSVTQGFTNSEHYEDSSLFCTDCHKWDPHNGTQGLPTYQNSCWGCHQTWTSLENFESTMHGQAGLVRQLFDQQSAGKLQATVVLPGGHETGLLFASDKKTKVTRDQRIAECSVCHSYISRYPNQFPEGGTPPRPINEVGCPACHDSHMQAPKSDDRPYASNTVQITAMNGSSVLQTSPPFNGRQVSYLNFKPYEVNATGAQDWVNGTWTRGSAIEHPARAVVSGTGKVSDGTGISDLFTLSSGTLKNVQPGNVLFVNGTATANAQLPDDAATDLVGKTVTVQATFKNAGIAIASVSADKKSANLVEQHRFRGRNPPGHQFNRPGGQGNRDLHESQWKNGKSSRLYPPFKRYCHVLHDK